MNRMMYVPIAWLMMQLNAPTWIWVVFWAGFAIDTAIAILEKAKGTKER